jgi:ketosteroid isomerase-like protein
VKSRNSASALFLAFCSLAACNRPAESTQAADAIRQQITKYLEALNAADIGLASQVWETSRDISFINPAVHSHGWDEVKGVYQYFGSAFSERKLTARDISVHVYGDSAWAEFTWHFDAKQKDNGAAVQTDGRETQVYRKLDGNRWALVHVHYSNMLATPPPAQ